MRKEINLCQRCCLRLIARRFKQGTRVLGEAGTADKRNRRRLEYCDGPHLAAGGPSAASEATRSQSGMVALLLTLKEQPAG